MPPNLDHIQAQVKEKSEKFTQASREMSQVIVGQKDLLERLLLALLADGHVILEGLPGLAKTLAITTLAQVLQCDYKRIQFTPDLLPADLIGTTIYHHQEQKFSIKKGPIFTHLLLADEINRAPAKVQSALLEVMQEKQVTIGGETFKLEEPFLVLATQNPVEQEGTYILPEAQTDRFMMKVKIDYPSKEEEKEILKRMARLDGRPSAQGILTASDILEARKVVNSIHIDEKVTDYILDIVFATRYPERYDVDIENLLLFGASPRASITLQLGAKAHAFLSGRPYVTPDDVKAICFDVLRHRLRRSYEAEAEEITPDAIITQILETLPVP